MLRKTAGDLSCDSARSSTAVAPSKKQIARELLPADYALGIAGR
jgi:hypothetical protein